jgi:hypothetical protein
VKIEYQVRGEIPYKNDERGCQLACVKVHFELLVKQVQEKVVQAQPYQAEQYKPAELGFPARVGAFKSPDPVEDIIVHHGQRKANDVGQVLVPAQLFLAQPGNTEIDKNTHCTSQAKFDYFQEKL